MMSSNLSMRRKTPSSLSGFGSSCLSMAVKVDRGGLPFGLVVAALQMSVILIADTVCSRALEDGDCGCDWLIG